MQSVRSNQAQSDSQAVSPRASVFTIENNGCNNVDFDTHLAPGREIESRPRVGQLEPPPRSPPDRAHGTNSPTQTSPNHDEPLSLWEEPPIHSDSRRSGIYRAFQQNSESREALASAPWNERSSSHTSSRSHSQTNHGQLVEENDLRLLVENEVWGDKGQSLPADDGMRILRQRIHGIRESHTSKTEKARQIHAIMTENYRSLLKVSEPAQSGLQRGAIQSHERPLTPLSSRSKRSSDQFTLTPESLSSAWSTSGSPYYLSLNDLTPTYVPRLATSSQSYGDDDLVLSSQTAEGTDLLDGEVQQELGCQHYKRNVKLQCYTCKRWHTCRFCHDDVEDHTLNRHKTENMLCMVCQTPQQASHWCKSCGTQAACYYCGLCKLWDNDPSKSIYHCHDCGICRRGQGLGKDFFHCKTCSVCLPIKIETSHRCIERATQCDCPICGDYMFTSPYPVIFMKCGHSIHQKCFDKYSKTSYRCPICNKSVTNMEAHFRNLDHAIESQPMPAEFQNTKAVIHCNDCRAKSVVQYHWLGLKCDVCDSYNTSQIRLFSTNDGQNDETDSHQDRGIPISRPRDSNDSATESRTMARSVPGMDGASDLPGPVLGGEEGTLPSSTFPPSFNARSVSPTVSNYFGLSRRRGSMWTTVSQPEVIHSDSEHEEDGSFWAVSALKRATLGLLGRRAYESEEEKEDGDEEDDGMNDQEGEPAEGEDDEEIDDIIDIFGHR